MRTTPGGVDGHRGTRQRPLPAADTGHPAPPAPDAPSDEDIGWPKRCAPPGP
ncbi:hypothetical protein [Streptomyces mirabilis]|uniref:Uncharacterized protein n=1 Tax=Streptomyces mirabilis TaxID=68239 RepID=A0ABU3V7R3_9ACTN|nr:hypothetical protein [Streptomyces mirabilis]MDU9002198.1 hypothetical protein [Streptomyces mirabilis]